MDQFYTPTNLAQTLVNHVRTDEKRPYIADFTVGNGELLRAASARWPKARMLGVDINPKAVESLSRQHRSWLVVRCNFLDRRQRNASEELTDCGGKVSVALLNPPFSNRGAQRQRVELYGEKVACSLGLAFLITALSYLAPHGKLVAIMPAGTLHSEKDREAWEVVDQFFCRSVLSTNGDRTFKDCLAKTVVVRLAARSKAKTRSVARKVSPTNTKPTIVGSVRIERGTVDMPSLSGTCIKIGVPLVHTTELRENRVDLTARCIDASRATLKSYAVLLPRVGRPKAEKICLYTKCVPVALSNCVLAVKCSSLEQAQSVLEKLLSQWEGTKKAYVGTCAQYMTVERLGNLLSTLRLPIEEK